MRAFLSLLLLSSAALAGPPAPRKVGALVVPADDASAAMVLRLEAHVNEALREFSDFQVRSSDEIFGLAPDQDAALALQRADAAYAESRTAYDARSYVVAEGKLNSTLREYGKAAAALRTCGKLCDAVAMYASVLMLRGDSEEAKITLLDLLSLGPAFDLDRKRYTQDFLNLKAQVATSRNAQLRGNVAVKTVPPGARVFFNGEQVGYAPMQVASVPLGKGVLRVERPGFKVVGRLAEVTPEDQELVLELVPGQAFTSYQALLPRLGAEALKDKGGATMQALAKSLDLERGVVLNTRFSTDTERLDVTFSYVDLKTGKKFSQKRSSFDGDEYGQLRGEVVRITTALINAAEGPQERAVRSSDPLDNRAGTEDWSAEDKGGKGRAKEQKSRGGDPLDKVSGTEDW